MKVWVYVEGDSDRLGLEALWTGWRQRLRPGGWGIQVIPLEDKSRYFRKIGAHAAEKLIADSRDLVVGLPDLYPNRPYAGTEFPHSTVNELMEVQRRLVREELTRKGISETLLDRFFPSALKHDFEMLVLAACPQLRAHLGTTEKLGAWRHPVEDQNQDHPPKRVVEALYLTKKGRSYRDTTDAPAVLRNVTDLRPIIYLESGQLQCPVFKVMLDWVGAKTGVAAY